MERVRQEKGVAFQLEDLPSYFYSSLLQQPSTAAEKLASRSPLKQPGSSIVWNWPVRRPGIPPSGVPPMTEDDVCAAAEHLVEFHQRFAPLFGKEQAQDHWPLIPLLKFWREKRRTSNTRWCGACGSKFWRLHRGEERQKGNLNRRIMARRWSNPPRTRRSPRSPCRYDERASEAQRTG